MKRKLLGKVLCLAVSTSLVASLSACSMSSAQESAEGASDEVSGAIEVTMGRQTLQNVSFPEGDSYEDNAYMRMTQKELNIKIVDEFEANGDDYDRQVSLALSSGEIPDIMKVGSRDELRELYENDLIADLTDVYEEYGSDYLKSLYDSYDGRALADVTYDGQMMAIPGTGGDPGPSIVWVRSDWTSELGITLDEDGNGCITIDELENLAKEFMAQNPENAENPVGMAFAPWLTSDGSDGTFSMNAIAYSLGAFPKRWLVNEDGTISYGSTSQEMKDTLEIAARWFQEGILDPQVGTRTWDDITALLANGQCGIAMGTWHIPDWLLNNVYAMNDKAVFDAYVVEGLDGKVACTHGNATGGYIVVSKKFKHPEVAIEIANLFYDRLVNDKELLEEYPEVKSYVENAMDGSARPFNIEITAYTDLLDNYQEIKKCIDGEITIDDVKSIEQSNNVTKIQEYLDGTGDATSWSKYHSRMKGVALIQNLTDNDQFKWIDTVFPETTATMETNWSNLQTLEEETFIRIVTGDLPVDEGFDQFVNDWNQQGGETIISEITEQLQ